MAEIDINPSWKPFVRNKDSFGIFTRLRVYFFAPIFFPLRLLAIVILVGWYFIVLRIGFISFKKIDFSKPPSSWRKTWFILPAQPIARCLLFILGFVYIKKAGSPEMGNGRNPCNIIVCNHQTYLDILIMMAVFPKGIPSFVAKKEVQKVPLIGYCAVIWQSFFIENRIKNSNKSSTCPSLSCPPTSESCNPSLTSKHQTLDSEKNKFNVFSSNISQGLKYRSEHLEYPPVLVFPEGTTTNGDYLVSFKSGAFLSGNPVKPVGFHYPVSGGVSLTWETIPSTWHAYLYFSNILNYAEIKWLPTYYPSKEEKEDPQLYANNVRKSMSKLLNIPTVDASYQDKLDYHYSIGFIKRPNKN